MYKLTAQNGQTKYGICEFVVDTIEDMENLPPCDMGSSCLVLSTPPEVYMKDGNGEWKQL